MGQRDGALNLGTSGDSCSARAQADSDLPIPDSRKALGKVLRSSSLGPSSVSWAQGWPERCLPCARHTQGFLSVPLSPSLERGDTAGAPPALPSASSSTPVVPGLPAPPRDSPLPSLPPHSSSKAAQNPPSPSTIFSALTQSLSLSAPFFSITSRISLASQVVAT